jgi:hypothetical protein
MAAFDMGQARPINAEDDSSPNHIIIFGQTHWKS